VAEPSAEKLLSEAVKQTKQGNLPVARKLIQASIRKDPANPTAWLVFASIAATKREKLLCLKKVLELSPGNAQARKMAQSMGIDPAKLTEKPASADQGVATQPPADKTDEADEEDPPDYLTYQQATVVQAPPQPEPDDEPPADEPPDTPQAIPAADVPNVSERPDSFDERLALATEEADRIALDFLEPAPTPPGVTWVKKESNRAGENEILIVRAALATSLAVFIGVPLILLGIFVYNTTFFQSLISEEQRVSGLQTLTPTPTPLTTPTNTPGFTPTPSRTPSPIPTEQVASIATPTETPTVDSFIRQGDPDINNIQSTEVFLPGGVANRAVREGVVLIEQGNEAVALATLQNLRGDLEDATTFNQESALGLYTEALALSAQGDGEAALELLQAGEALRQEFTRSEDVTSLAAIRAGLAQAYFAIGNEQQLRGATGAAAQNFAQAQSNAREAIDVQPDWPEPYLVLVRSQIAQRQYSQALSTIDEVQTRTDLRQDVRFIVQRGEVALLQEDFDEAEYLAFVAHYADPISADAHDLRTRVAIAQNDISSASLYVQEYLYYHPLSIRGWQTLGRVRLLEGNTNLALAAFTQAITISENTDRPPALNAYVERADLYEQRGQLNLALADVTAAAQASQNPELLQRQLNLTLELGNASEARQLADTLVEEGVLSEGAANFVEARLLAQREELTTGDYAQIARLIDDNFAAIPGDLQPLANQLRAEAYLEQGQTETALNFIESALNAGETAPRHLIRAQALEANGQYSEAVREYERVLTLNRLIAVDDNVVQSADAGLRSAQNLLQEERGFATATAQAR